MDENFLDKKQLKMLKLFAKNKTVTVIFPSEKYNIVRFLSSCKLVRQKISKDKNCRCYEITQAGLSALAKARYTKFIFWLPLVVNVVFTAVSIILQVLI